MIDQNDQVSPIQLARRGSPIGWQVGVSVISALMAPFLLWPIEQVIPQPVIIEELFKAGLVWMVLKGTKEKRAQWVLLTAIAFAVSETLFYVVPAIADMSWGNWGWRWVTTVPMHLLTFLVQYAGWMVGAWPLGLIGAAGIHMGFNQIMMH